jgi:flagellar hook-length control protein FliK
MTPHAIIAVRNDMTPQHAPTATAAPNGLINFAQFLDNAATSPTQATNLGTQAAAPISNLRAKAKANSDDAVTANAVVVPINPAPVTANVAPATANAAPTTANAIAVAANAAAGPANVVAVPANAAAAAVRAGAAAFPTNAAAVPILSALQPTTPSRAQAASSTTPVTTPVAVTNPNTAQPVTQNAAGAANPTTGQSAGATNGPTTPVPPGAAELNARVAAGAPNYLSQPNNAISGLWHHAGDTPATADDGSQTGDGAANEAAPEGATAAATPGTEAAKSGAAFAAALPSAAHAAPGVDSSAADTAEAMQADATAATTTATAGAAVTTDATTLGASGSAPSTAAPSAAYVPASAPATVLPVYQQVAINLKQAAQAGTDHIEIQLKPASLGAIDVKLNLTHDGRITAVISADRSDTLHLLRQDSSGLEQALRDAGLQADSSSLSFNLRGDAQSFAQQSAPASTNGDYATATNSTDAQRSDAPRSRRHDGTLDIEV